MEDRFRLIYLKSTELEKSKIGEPSLPYESEKNPSPPTLSGECHSPDTFTSQAILQQAKADLKHPDPKIRILAIQYLEKSDSSVSLPLLQEILSDRDPEVRARGLNALIQFRNPIVSSLFRKYLKDSDPGVRIAALRGMFRFREKIDLNILLQFLSDESPWVRRKVATLLGWSRIEGVLPILMEMSKDEDSKVRKAALFSMTTLYPDETEDRLIEAMTDRDPEVRWWVREALEKRIEKTRKRAMAFVPN